MSPNNCTRNKNILFMLLLSLLDDSLFWRISCHENMSNLDSSDWIGLVT